MKTSLNADANFKTGAVRSADANHLDFTSLPMIGLISVARTASEGAEKYGRLNYLQGLPSHDLINHSMRHIVLHLLGDRSEPHLPHAAWGLLAAIQSEALDADLCLPHLVGPGNRLTEANQKLLDSNKEALFIRRKDGAFDKSGLWNVADLPEVERIVSARKNGPRSADGWRSTVEYVKGPDHIGDLDVTEAELAAMMDTALCDKDSAYADHVAGKLRVPEAQKKMVVETVAMQERLEELRAIADDATIDAVGKVDNRVTVVPTKNPDDGVVADMVKFLAPEPDGELSDEERGYFSHGHPLPYSARVRFGIPAHAEYLEKGYGSLASFVAMLRSTGIMPYEAIAKELNGLGFRTKRGREFTASIAREIGESAGCPKRARKPKDNGEIVHVEFAGTLADGEARPSEPFAEFVVHEEPSPDPVLDYAPPIEQVVAAEAPVEVPADTTKLETIVFDPPVKLLPGETLAIRDLGWTLCPVD